MNWLPIESAPKDGSEVLVYVPRRLGALYAAASNKTGDQWWGRNLGDINPTHWMPLPPPPTDDEPDGLGYDTTPTPDAPEPLNDQEI